MQLQGETAFWVMVAVGIALMLLFTVGGAIGLIYLAGSVSRYVRKSVAAPREQARTNRMSELAARLRVEFEPEVDPSLVEQTPFAMFARHWQIRLFGGDPPRRVCNVFHWRAAGVEFHVFDSLRLVKQFYAGTATCLVRCPKLALPPFKIRPEHRIEESLEKFLWVLNSLVDEKDIDFEENREFSKAFYLSSPNEPETRARFTESVQRWFVERQIAYHIEARDGWLVLSRGYGLAGERETVELMKNAVQLVKLLSESRSGD